MTLDDWLLLVHVLSGAVWLGAGVTLVLLSGLAREQGTMFQLVQQMEWIGPRIGPPVSLGLVGTGIWIVLRRSDVGFLDPWIVGALAGFVVLLAIGVGYHTRQYRKINTAAAEHGETSKQVETLIAGSFRAAQVEVFLLLIVFGLMVFKPGI